MPDNVPITAGTGTDIATDLIGGAHYQRVKVTFGVDGTATDASAGNPLPVTGPLTDTELRATALPVSGTVAVTGTFWQATQPVSGTVGVSGSVAVTGTFWQATQPVSGTVTANAGTGTFAISAASLPLPSGASTSAKQPALGTAGTASSDVLTVQGIASMTAIKVDGSAVTQPVSAASLPLPTGAATSAKQDTIITAVQGATPAGENHIGGVHGWAFDVAVTPTVTNGAYSPGDIVGALLTFASVARVNDEAVLITGAQVVSKAAVTPSLTLILFNADPSSTTKTDNAAYSLNSADAFRVVAAIPLNGGWTDHGTPNSTRVDNLGIVAKPVSGGRDLYGLLIDGTGATLTSTGDIQVRLRGMA
jgi:hypothetical protein